MWMWWEVDKMRVPKHVALVVDGNRRWARQQKLAFFDAYKLAGNNLVDIVCTAASLRVGAVTAFLFSTENWKRDPAEVDAVMTAFGEILLEHTNTFKRCGVRVHIIGDVNGLPTFVQKAVSHAMSETKECKRINFVMAFNYGGRWDILEAIKRAAESLKNSDLNDLTAKTFSAYLSTAPFGDPDLLIRTGAQRRVSNFMLWQLAYSELYFSDLMWPDFTPEQFRRALADYDRRERRKGA